jgi:hypothetical protein
MIGGAPKEQPPRKLSGDKDRASASDALESGYRVIRLPTEGVTGGGAILPPGISQVL